MDWSESIALRYPTLCALLARLKSVESALDEMSFSETQIIHLSYLYDELRTCRWQHTQMVDNRGLCRDSLYLLPALKEFSSELRHLNAGIYT